MQKKLESTAFPHGYHPSRHSKVHEVLYNPHEFVGIHIRPFQQQDLNQLILLHQQWFPLQYTNSFYGRVKAKTVQCKIAQATILQEGEKKNIIAGVLIYEYQTAGNILKCEKWSQYLYWNYLSIYIMTVGVIDQFRGMGIGKRFLQLLIKEANENPMIKYIHLHMVSYNSASLFYEKNGFQSIQTLTNHYDNIKGRPQDAKHYVKFFNGGTKRLGWLQWVKNIWGN